MDIKLAFEKAHKSLESLDQQHLLAFFSQLNDSQKQDLLTQINALDLRSMGPLIDKYVKNQSVDTDITDFAPPPFFASTPKDDQRQKYDRAVSLGEELISTGKVAAFVVAGGQGTRLGFDGPKGDFPISPVKNKSLFRLFAEYIAAANDKYDTNCPWYIMTSPLNDEQTKDIFANNDYFGLNKEDIFIFRQAAMPNFSFDGKILLADKDSIACSPDGHGGSLKALFASGAIDDMKKRGAEYISYFQVDNPLINIFDPLFIGLHALEKAEMSSKALKKNHPLEKVGNFCLVDGKITVIEYSDLPREKANLKNPDGSLVFELGSIAIHIINTSFVEKLNEKGFSLPIHRAVKKIPFIDETGKLIEPDQPNGIKLETFVFDAIPMAGHSIILETPRAEEFAPVKNAQGDDSPQVTREMMTDRAACWLESAGIKVPRKADGRPNCTIEMAPSFALDRDDIKKKINKVPEIKPGDAVYLD